MRSENQFERSCPQTFARPVVRTVTWIRATLAVQRAFNSSGGITRKQDPSAAYQPQVLTALIPRAAVCVTTNCDAPHGIWACQSTRYSMKEGLDVLLWIESGCHQRMLAFSSLQPGSTRECLVFMLSSHQRFQARIVIGASTACEVVEGCAFLIRIAHSYMPSKPFSWRTFDVTSRYW